MQRYGWQRRKQQSETNSQINKQIVEHSTSNNPQILNGVDSIESSKQQKYSQSQHQQSVSAREGKALVRKISEISPKIIFQHIDEIPGQQRQLHKNTLPQKQSRGGELGILDRKKSQSTFQVNPNQSSSQSKQIRYSSVQRSQPLGMKIEIKQNEIENNLSYFTERSQKIAAENQNNMPNGNGFQSQRVEKMGVKKEKRGAPNQEIDSQHSVKCTKKTQIQFQKQKTAIKNVQKHQTNKKLILCFYLRKIGKKNLHGALTKIFQQKDKTKNYNRFSVLGLKIVSRVFLQKEKFLLMDAFKKFDWLERAAKPKKVISESKFLLPKLILIITKNKLRKVFGALKLKKVDSALRLVTSLCKCTKKYHDIFFQKLTKNFLQSRSLQAPLHSIELLLSHKHQLSKQTAFHLLQSSKRNLADTSISLSMPPPSHCLSPAPKSNILQHKGKATRTTIYGAQGLRRESQVLREGKEFAKEREGLELRVQELRQIVSEYHYQLESKHKAKQELTQIKNEMEQSPQHQMSSQQNLSCKNQLRNFLSQIYFKIIHENNIISVSELQKINEKIKDFVDVQFIEKLGKQRDVWELVKNNEKLRKEIYVFQCFLNKEEVLNGKSNAKMFVLKEEEIMGQFLADLIKQQYNWCHVANIARKYIQKN